MAFKGSCHCGAIRYTVDEDPPMKAMQCNCSICSRKAPLHHFTTPDKFTLETPRDAVATYKWNTGNIGFHHCQTCGCAPFAEGKGPQGPDGRDQPALRRRHRPGRARDHAFRRRAQAAWAERLTPRPVRQRDKAESARSQG